VFGAEADSAGKQWLYKASRAQSSGLPGSDLRSSRRQGAFKKPGIVAADVQSALICVPSEGMRRLHVGGCDS